MTYTEANTAHDFGDTHHSVKMTATLRWSDLGITYTWKGGEYIDVAWEDSGYVFDVINVMDYRTGEVTITTLKEFSDVIRRYHLLSAESYPEDTVGHFDDMAFNTR